MGPFLDTNILFDAIYPTRALYTNYHKFFDSRFKSKELCIVTPVDVEACKIATESVELLARIVRNEIVNKQWDGLNAKQRDAILNGIKGTINSDSEVKKLNRTFNVTDAFNRIRTRLLVLMENEIYELCHHLTYLYLRDLQEQISILFTITPPDGIHVDYNNCKKEITQLNQNSGAFSPKNDQDFDICSDMTLVLIVGVRFFNNYTTNFNYIEFYCRDDGSLTNFSKLKAHVTAKASKNNNEIKIEDAFNRLNFQKPY